MIKFILTFLSASGMWKPRGWHGIKAFLYYIYQFTVFFCNFLFIISSILIIELKDINVEELIDNMSLLLAIINARQKMSLIIFERRSIEYISDKLEKSPFKSCDSIEKAISTKFDGIVRNVFICYSITIGAMLVYCGSRFTEVNPSETLPFNGWFPYNYSSPTVYWLTAAFQVIAINITNGIDLLMDLLLSSILCSMCGQIHLLKHRFKVMLEALNVMTSKNDGSDMATTEKLMISEWVEYHIDLVNLIKYTNTVFSNVILLQYTVSSVILCAVSFLMSRTEIMSMTFAGFLGYLITFNTQIFQQCYCAHMLTHEATNWPSLSNNTRKSVMIIMYKCHKPIMITSSFFVILSLDSYTKIVKLAYTIFNVLI
ncbi:GSCOCT00010033001.3-RA-CDS [Cotesia congregata]|uniref:Odorant receptor n=1 Tax=Cotesia congregata TaxID=51543 RepID=A0A8J2H7R0_COTCN|nr:GSCOCT00010033001.3-RA-CDS [Cotesia congregata]CAG5082906.1 olfactory receptor 193 [Cotesia congregata]